MTYQTPATLTDEERDYLVSALKERGITPEKWNESRQLLAEFFEFVNDNRDYLKRLGNYVTREVEKDPRQGEAVFEDTYIEDILSRAIEAMEAPGEQKSLGLLMNGSMVRSLEYLLATGGEPRDSSVTRTEKWDKKEGKDSVTFIRRNRGVTQVITITNPVTLFPGYGKTGKVSATRKRGTFVVRKMLPYVLQRMTEQGYPHEVRIELKTLADKMGYTSVDSAYRAIKSFFKKIETVSIAATETKMVRSKDGKGKEKKAVSDDRGKPFYWLSRRNGSAYISVAEQFPIRLFSKAMKEFTVFPDWAYLLGPVAFDLVWYIFYLARQNTRDVASSGTFTISLESVRHQLGLPTPDDVSGRQYRQQIRTPIEEAIEEIEKRVAETPEAKGNFFITPHVDEATTDIDQWLKGYLEIELRNEYAQFFKKIATSQEKKIGQHKASTDGKRSRARKGK